MATPTSTLADARSGIEAGNRAFARELERGDAARLANLYTESAQLLPAHGDFVTGRAAIEHFWQQAIAMGLTGAALETLEAEGLGNTAYEVGRYTLRLATGEVADTGKYVVIWKRDGDTWRLHRDIWTTSRPTAT